MGHQIANPGPLGLCGFALTTFVLSCYNAGIFRSHQSTPVNVVVGAAVFYGGLAQGLAGMWEMASGNTFAATAFTSYGAFWLSYAALLIPWFGVGDAFTGVSTTQEANALAIFLMAWTIFTFLLFLASFRTNVALVVLFAFLTTTFALLTAAEYKNNLHLKRAGGYFGVFTAVVAWYVALAGLLSSSKRPLINLPVISLDGDSNS